MAAAYYPVQTVNIGGGLVKNAQSCSVDFNQAKQPVYAFGQLLAKGTFTAQLPSISLSATAAIIEGMPFTLKFDDAELKKTSGNTASVDTGGGKFTFTNCYLQSVGGNASVGQIATANQAVVATSMTYSIAAPTAAPTIGGNQLDISKFSPGLIKISSVGAAKSFSFSATIDREPVLPLGADPTDSAKMQTIDWIIKGLKAKAEAEVFIATNVIAPGLNKESELVATVNNFKMGYKGFVNTVKTSLGTDGVATVSVGIDEDILKVANVTFA
jgi:hypothetical protein